MRHRKIRDNDCLFRHSVYPLVFRGSTFAPEKLMKICDQDDGSLLASLAWQCYLPTTDYIHAYGCRLAAGINEKKRMAGKFKDKNRHVYCGAYQLRASAIRTLSATEGLDEVLSVDVLHHIENGEIAHADLRIVLKGEGRTDIEGTKTAIVDRLWNICSGPLQHICGCDGDINPHPSSILAHAPAGPYSDNRSNIVQLWHVIRFQVCNWLSRQTRLH